MASLQRANSNSSVNQTEDDSSFREQTVIAPRYVCMETDVINDYITINIKILVKSLYRGLVLRSYFWLFKRPLGGSKMAGHLNLT